MTKITFIGAGSTILAKNVLGDVMLTDALRDSHIALYDIDSRRLEESRQMVKTLNTNLNDGKARVTAHPGCGEPERGFQGCRLCHQCHSGWRLRTLYGDGL